MIPSVDYYEDCKDQINDDENGQLSVGLFHRFSWRAQLRLMDWLSGDVAAVQPPEPYLSQKNMDFLKPFIVRLEANVEKGKVPIPVGYYRMQNWYIINGLTEEDCSTKETVQGGAIDSPGEILDGAALKIRERSYIKGLRPSIKNPVLSIVDNHFEFSPKDPGSIAVNYIRYPKQALLDIGIDPIYHEQTVTAKQNLEWDEAVRDVLVWFTCDLFFNRSRERAAKEAHIATQKTVRG